MKTSKFSAKAAFKISLVAILAILTAFSLCGCSFLLNRLFGSNDKKEEDPIYETEYFRYEVEQYSSGESYVVIRGLTELGKQQKYLIVPNYIGDLSVEAYYGFDVAPKLKKIFIPYNMRSINIPLFPLFSGPKNEIIAREDSEGILTFYISCTYQRLTDMPTRHLSDKYYISTIAEESYAKSGRERKFTITNTQYLLNYAIENYTSEEYNKYIEQDFDLIYSNEKEKKVLVLNGGVHFIDNIEIGEKIEVIPPVPIRDGFTFTGWYYEPECVNKIDFENYVRKDEEILSLYAGWREI